MAEQAAAKGPLPVVPFLKIPPQGTPYLEGQRCKKCSADLPRRARELREVRRARLARSLPARRTRASSTSTRSCTARFPASRCPYVSCDRRPRRRRHGEGQPDRHRSRSREDQDGNARRDRLQDRPAQGRARATSTSPTSSSRAARRRTEQRDERRLHPRRRHDQVRTLPGDERSAARRGGGADGARRRGAHDPGHGGALLREPLPGRTPWSDSASCRRSVRPAFPS